MFQLLPSVQGDPQLFYRIQRHLSPTSMMSQNQSRTTTSSEVTLMDGATNVRVAAKFKVVEKI
jgi:hypothetical protein